MIVRIVKLHFKKENISSFERIFDGSKDTIKNFKGCSLLELYQDKGDSSVFFTYSQWETEADLEAYRNSDYFKEVWAKTKLLFEDRAEAWSVQQVHSLN